MVDYEKPTERVRPLKRNLFSLLLESFTHSITLNSGSEMPSKLQATTPPAWDKNMLLTKALRLVRETDALMSSGMEKLFTLSSRR